MKSLLVYPQYPDTFWSFKHALKFISKKAAFPPLGLLTIAAMLPSEWEKKLIDMNVTRLLDEDIAWADYVLISAMTVQQQSVQDVITRCNKIGTKIVCGGPLFTTGYQEFQGVDHFVLGEAEITLPLFLNDLAAGNAKHVYNSNERPPINLTPVPLWSLINMKNYSSMNIQYSRGCPFDCEFCDIVQLNGRIPRTKSKEQLISELEALYATGWRGGVFVVDDNFIGNKKKLKEEILPTIIKWRAEKRHSFTFNTEASINLADDDELLKLMIEAGFGTVFIGIETPNEESLVECAKTQNRNRSLVDSVKKMQRYGFEVQGGFIVGFDSDPQSIFKSQIDFIQKSGIVTAMVGLLNAPPGTRLYHRLKKENRLVKSFSGNNTEFSLNFVPKMEEEALISGYKHILNTIYAPKHFYSRVRTFLKEYRPPKVTGNVTVHFYHFTAFFKSIWYLGFKESGRWHFWKMFISTQLRQPRKLPTFIVMAIYGYHFRKVLQTV
jgi:radical SAM superfamily enzyme YgiQ (UPF0313 family)